MHYKNNKCIGAIVAIILLMTITVVSAIAYQTWIIKYQSQVATKTENDGNPDKMKTGISDLIGNTLYFNNNNIDNISITNIKINGKNCNKNLNISYGISEIDLNNCINESTEYSKNIVVITNVNIFEKNLYRKN